MNNPHQELAAIQERYRSRLRTTRDSLTAAITRRDRSMLQQMAHKLGGSAGTFGYSALAQAANSLEELLARDSTESGMIESATEVLFELDQIAVEAA